MLYRKKPVEVEASRWFSNGDHPQDHEGADKFGEGKVVRYFRHPDTPGTQVCKHCMSVMHVHGWIDTLEGGHIVCPGDWIITGVKGEYYPCKPDIFADTYDAVEEKPVPPVISTEPGWVVTKAQYDLKRDCYDVQVKPRTGGDAIIGWMNPDLECWKRPVIDKLVVVRVQDSDEFKPA